MDLGVHATGFTEIRASKAENLVPPAVESPIAVEDAVENRSLYHVFVSRSF